MFCSVLLCSVCALVSFSFVVSASVLFWFCFVLFFGFYTKTIKTSITYLGREFHQRQMQQKSRQNYANKGSCAKGGRHCPCCNLLRTFLVCLGLRFLASSGIVLPTFLVCLGLLPFGQLWHRFAYFSGVAGAPRPSALDSALDIQTETEPANKRARKGLKPRAHSSRFGCHNPPGVSTCCAHRVYIFEMNFVLDLHL